MRQGEIEAAVKLAREVQRLNVKRTQGEWFHDQRGWIVAVPDESRPSEEFEVMTDGGECSTSDGPFVALVANSTDQMTRALLALAERCAALEKVADAASAFLRARNTYDVDIMRSASKRLGTESELKAALRALAALDAGEGE